MGKPVENNMQNAKVFRNGSELYDVIESLKANLSITSELEKTDRKQLQLLDRKITTMEGDIQDIFELPLWRLLIRRSRRNK